MFRWQRQYRSTTKTFLRLLLSKTQDIERSCTHDRWPILSVYSRPITCIHLRTFTSVRQLSTRIAGTRFLTSSILLLSIISIRRPKRDYPQFRPLAAIPPKLFEIRIAHLLHLTQRALHARVCFRLIHKILLRRWRRPLLERASMRHERDHFPLPLWVKDLLGCQFSNRLRNAASPPFSLSN